jgi:hypothetical protein
MVRSVVRLPASFPFLPAFHSVALALGAATGYVPRRNHELNRHISRQQPLRPPCLVGHTTGHQGPELCNPFARPKPTVGSQPTLHPNP